MYSNCIEIFSIAPVNFIGWNAVWEPELPLEALDINAFHPDAPGAISLDAKCSKAKAAHKGFPGGVHAGRRSIPERRFSMTVEEFRRTRKPAQVGWIIMRVVHYRLRFYAGGTDAYRENSDNATCWLDREQAYAVREKVGGLILIIE